MENYNNLRELRYAEQTTVVEAQTQSPSFQQNPIGGSNAYKTPITRSPSSASIASEPENDDSNSDAEAHDDDDNEDDDANSKLSRDQNDEEGAGPPNGKPGAGGLAIRFSSLQPQSSYTDNPSTIIRRESSLLLQMVPYRSRLPDPIRSDRLIPGRQESDIKSGAQEAIDSVRLLLDKWTTLGSAPVSKILDEEAAQEEKEASVAVVYSFLKLLTRFLAKWPKIVESQALNPMRTDGRHRQELYMTKMMVPLITQDRMKIHISKITKSHLRYGMTHCHTTDIFLTDPIIHSRKTFGGHPMPITDHQKDNSGMKYWLHYALQEVAYII